MQCVRLTHLGLSWAFLHAFFSRHAQIAAHAAAASCFCSEPVHCVQQMMRERQRSGSPGRPAAWAPMRSIGPHAVSWVNLGTFRSPPAQQNHRNATTGCHNDYTRPSWGPEVGPGPIEADVVCGAEASTFIIFCTFPRCSTPQNRPTPPKCIHNDRPNPPQAQRWPHLSFRHHSDIGQRPGPMSPENFFLGLF